MLGILRFEFKMVVYTVFSNCVHYTYKTTICSKSTCFIFVVCLLTVIFPLVVAYNTHGFWLKSGMYQEQPDVHFKHEYVLVVETEKPDSPVLCSTFSAFTRLSNNTGFCSMVKCRETDTDLNNINDKLFFETEVLMQNSTAKSVMLLLLFDYKLHEISSLQMESMALIQHSSSSPGTRLDVVGDLRLVQKQLLSSRGRDLRFNASVFDLAMPLSDMFSFKSVLAGYAARNVSTRMSNVYSFWTVGHSPDAPFVISVVIHYPEETILYRPGFWQVIKWAWIQYLAILVLFVRVFEIVKAYVFSNQIMFAIKNVPWEKQR